MKEHQGPLSAEDLAEIGQEHLAIEAGSIDKGIRNQRVSGNRDRMRRGEVIALPISRVAINIDAINDREFLRRIDPDYEEEAEITQATIDTDPEIKQRWLSLFNPLDEPTFEITPPLTFPLRAASMSSSIDPGPLFIDRSVNKPTEQLSAKSAEPKKRGFLHWLKRSDRPAEVIQVERAPRRNLRKVGAIAVVGVLAAVGAVTAGFAVRQNQAPESVATGPAPSAQTFTAVFSEVSQTIADEAEKPAPPPNAFDKLNLLLTAEKPTLVLTEAETISVLELAAMYEEHTPEEIDNLFQNAS